ncbi:phage neck terminator protein [Rhodanobacter hydrolyticus]|uniref:Phage neck terminator protein gp12-like domain-containing protein n=1 Tax=Rhodanobacter hydrolyticus TaxID=2250595 RepID=A0ABW8J3N7_9GAMM
MTATIDITDQDVFGAVRSLLLSILPAGTEVVQGQDNRVPMPLQGANGGFVVMTSAGQTRLAYNATNYTPGTANPGTKMMQPATQYAVQLDFYGPSSAAWAAMTQAVFRDEYATDDMPANIQPLYADDPMQMPLIDGEEQYEQRWKLTANVQYNPQITVPQNFGDTFPIGVNSVDAVAPP